MSNFECKTCGSLNSRLCNADNSICTECGTPDDFIEIENHEDKMSNAEECELSNQELVTKCRKWVRKLCESGGDDWMLQVPVNENEDPDCLIYELCNRLEESQSKLQEVADEVEGLKGECDVCEGNQWKECGCHTDGRNELANEVLEIITTWRITCTRINH